MNTGIMIIRVMVNALGMFNTPTSALLCLGFKNRISYRTPHEYSGFDFGTLSFPHVILPKHRIFSGNIERQSLKSEFQIKLIITFIIDFLIQKK